MDENWQKITQLDLNSVRQKFEFKKGWWWRLGHSAERVEQEYRQFLFLIVSNPEKTVVPWSRDLDDFWHQHILDTAKYANDCNAILGRLIHHNPHLPVVSRAHASAVSDTRKMYRAAFGETARKRRGGIATDVGCGSEMPVVFCESSAPVSRGGHHGGHHTGGGHHGGHHDAGGHHGGGHDAGGGGHGGGHGCGGHGCGGHG